MIAPAACQDPGLLPATQQGSASLRQSLHLPLGRLFLHVALPRRLRQAAPPVPHPCPDEWRPRRLVTSAKSWGPDCRFSFRAAHAPLAFLRADKRRRGGAIGRGPCGPQAVRPHPRWACCGAEIARVTKRSSAVGQALPPAPVERDGRACAVRMQASIHINGGTEERDGVDGCAGMTFRRSFSPLASRISSSPCPGLCRTLTLIPFLGIQCDRQRGLPACLDPPWQTPSSPYLF